MTNGTTIQPFERGDMFAGATLLNDPKDDHAGPGRILQYDGNLEPKGVLWLRGTTHLVGGLTFGPDGNLWAFDSNSHSVVRVSPEGLQLPKIDFPPRSFSNVNFGPDGSLYLGEHLVGDKITLPPERPLKTTLSKVPGTAQFGFGHVYKCDGRGNLIKEYATATNGGMPGFLGVTSATLAPDGKTLVYVSELGGHVYRYDLEADRQLPDLVTFDPASGDRSITVRYGPDGRLFFVRANFRTGFVLQILNSGGTVQKSYELADKGWASIGPSIDPKFVFLGNFFTGTIGKFDLGKGEIAAKAETGVQRSLAGLAQYPGRAA